MKEKIALYIVVKNLYYDLFLINGEMGTKINGFFVSIHFYFTIVLIMRLMHIMS